MNKLIINYMDKLTRGYNKVKGYIATGKKALGVAKKGYDKVQSLKSTASFRPKRSSAPPQKKVVAVAKSSIPQAPAAPGRASDKSYKKKVVRAAVQAKSSVPQAPAAPVYKDSGYKKRVVENDNMSLKQSRLRSDIKKGRK